MKSVVTIKSVKTAQLTSRQRGTVLIIALLVVAVITGLAVNFSSRFQLSMVRGEQRLYSGQLSQYWLGMESFAMFALREDKKADRDDHGNNPYDHRGEFWATEEVQAPLEGGFAVADLEDLQGRFNLNQLAGTAPRPNNLAPGATLSFAQRYTAQQKRFIRLLQTTPGDGVSTTDAEAIAEAVMDWIDGDEQVTGLGGAESDYYLSQDPPVRAANQAFVSVSELRLIRGMTDEIYEHIAPLVTVLPDNSGININTASAAILRTLNAPDVATPLSEDDGVTLYGFFPAGKQAEDLESLAANETQDTDKDEGVTQVEAFFESDDFQQVFGADADAWPPREGLITGSNFFLLSAEVEVAEVRRQLFSLIRRVNASGDQTRTHVIRRGGDDQF